MKKQLKELQDLIIEKIINEEYQVLKAWFEGDYFNISIDIDGIMFNYAIPNNKKYFVDYMTNVINLNKIQVDEKDLSVLLYDRHFEPIKKQEIEKQISELQKQLR